MRVSSETPFTGCRIVTRSETSWYASRSDVATTTGPGPAGRRRRHGGPGPRVARRGEEVVRLVAACLADLEAVRLGERGHHAELLEDRRLEHAARLVGGKRLVAV